MPFIESKFSAQFMGLVLDRLQTVLERDTEAALRAIDETLPVFADFRTRMEDVLNFPALYLEPDRSKITQSDDDEQRNSTHGLVISLSVVGPDDYTLIRTVLKYVRAVDQVVSTMTAAELVGDPNAAMGHPAWEVTDHLYSVSKSKEGNTNLRRDAQLVVQIEIMEL